jgi:aminoglycoside phosphotransferase (APT) family kinase protein
MRRVRRGPLPALQRLCEELFTNLPEQCPTSTLVHGDAKPGNFAFVNGGVSALFDWELVAVGDPLTDIGWMEVVWMQPVGIPSHPSALTIDDLIEHYESASGITVRHRPWYRALAAFKMAVICLIGSRLFHDGFSDDRRLVLNASAIPYFTQIGLAELGVEETLEAGPVMPANA